MKSARLAALLLATATTAGAQSTEYGPFALRLPASARAVAMANIAVAGRDDDVLFYNPAQLFIARGTSASLTSLGNDWAGGTMSTVLRIGPGAIGIGVNHIEYQYDSQGPGYPFVREDLIGRSSDFIATSTHAALGYAQVWKGVRWGASANYAVDQVGLARYRNVVADVGAAKDFARFFTAGLSLQHLGLSAEAPGLPEEMSPPMKATLGIAGSGPVGPFDILLTTAASAQREGTVSGGFGAEVGWSWLSGYSILGRGGIRHPTEPGEPALSAGFGFIADRLSIDIAAEFFDNNRTGYRAGLRIR